MSNTGSTLTTASDQALETVFREGTISLAWQPIVPLHPDGQANWVEVLARPRLNGYSFSASSFVGRAAKLRVARPLDLLTLHTALKWLTEQTWVELCSINLSGQSLSVTGFREQVERVLDSFDVAPARICFEVTETVPVQHFEAARAFARAMRRRGCKMAMDDFGSGASHLQMLTPPEMDFIKMDGCFVKDAGKNQDSHQLVRALMAFSNVMGIPVVAECVEDRHHLAILRRMGVKYIQGYYNQGAPRAIEESVTRARHAKNWDDFRAMVPGDLCAMLRENGVMRLLELGVLDQLSEEISNE